MKLILTKSQVKGHQRRVGGNVVFVKPHRRKGDKRTDMPLFDAPTPKAPAKHAARPVQEQEPKPPVREKALVEIQLKRDGYVLLPKAKIKSMADVAFCMKEIADSDREKFCAIHMDADGKVLATEIVSIGTLSSAPVEVSSVMKGVIVSGAKKVAFVHNHPSGDSSPSSDDIRMTGKLRALCDHAGVEMIGHAIVTEDMYRDVEQPASAQEYPEGQDEGAKVKDLTAAIGQKKQGGRPQIDGPDTAASYAAPILNGHSGSAKDLFVVMLDTKHQVTGWLNVGPPRNLTNETIQHAIVFGAKTNSRAYALVTREPITKDDPYYGDQRKLINAIGEEGLKLKGVDYVSVAEDGSFQSFVAQE